MADHLNIMPAGHLLAMTSPFFKVLPDIFAFEHPEISVTHCLEEQLETHLPSFQASIEEGVVGLAPVYDQRSRLTTLAMATDTQVLIVALSAEASQSFKYQKPKNRPELPKYREILHAFLCDSAVTKFAFLMDRLVAGLFLDHNLRIVRAKDLLSISPQTRHSEGAYFDALGGYRSLKPAAVRKLFEHEETSVNAPRVTALQAWAAYSTACFDEMMPRHIQSPVINTLTLDVKIMAIIAKTIRNAYCSVALKPTRVKNDVQAMYHSESKRLVVTSERYKTRVLRPSGTQVYNIMTDKPDGTQQEYKGRPVNVTGRTSIFEVSGVSSTTVIRGMETVGREKATMAETARERYMLEALQGRIDLAANEIIMTLWYAPPSPSKLAYKVKTRVRKSQKKCVTTEDADTPSTPLPPPPPPPINYSGPLNESQKEAVNKILNTDAADSIVLIHGPPGTGKTTVIAAAVNSIINSSKKDATVWLVAHSNVAVKNIAEKLASVDFQDFKILVSKDFHFDWHEHLYEKIESNLIRSDEICDDAVATERQLCGSRVIICTLSMLAADHIATFTRQVPLQTVIFDEASQIEMGGYLVMLLRYKSALRKLVFIGDDKQLAPHGSEDINNIKSVFEKLHLRERALFLDTQYRMPSHIGDFVSTRVYKGRLKSVHPISDPKSCRFVDVAHGSEVSKGNSWQNLREVDVAIAIARQLTGLKKSFRIITPYDPQRGLLENGLKEADLPWKDKCFNVDSFQGNEDDYIIISLVRTVKLGFLNDRRRANVMLTRCKKGLIICTNRKFIEGSAEGSLVGELCKSFEESPWISATDVQQHDIRPFV